MQFNIIFSKNICVFLFFYHFSEKNEINVKQFSFDASTHSVEHRDSFSARDIG